MLFIRYFYLHNIDLIQQFLYNKLDSYISINISNIYKMYVIFIYKIESEYLIKYINLIFTL